MGCNCGGSSSEPRVRRRTQVAVDANRQQQSSEVPSRLKNGGGLFWTGNKRPVEAK